MVPPGGGPNELPVACAVAMMPSPDQPVPVSAEAPSSDVAPVTAPSLRMSRRGSEVGARSFMMLLPACRSRSGIGDVSLHSKDHLAETAAVLAFVILSTLAAVGSERPGDLHTD